MNYSIFTNKLPFLLFLIFFLNACKKEEVFLEKSKPELEALIASYQNGSKIKTISFQEFLSKVNVNSLGTLKSAFTGAKSTGRFMSVNVPETYSGFALDKDSVKVLTVNAHTSYVFAVKLNSPRAYIFQNLTIEESNEGTKAFVSTYIPTKKWIADYKAGKKTMFEGDIKFTKVDLQNSIGGNSTSAGMQKMSATGPMKNSLAQVCDSYTSYIQFPYKCSIGEHWPGEPCAIAEGLIAGSPAGWANIPVTITDCYTPSGPSGPGGGGTTPNYPPGYDPCGGGVGNNPGNNQIIVEKGLRLAVLPPSDCDPGGGDGGGGDGQTDQDKKLEFQKEIDVSELDSCAKKVLNQLKSLTSIPNFIATFAGEIPGYDWKIKSGVLPGDRNAETYPYNMAFNKVVTTFDNSKFSMASDLAYARTLLHESFHAYLNTKIALDPNGTRLEFPESLEAYKNSRSEFNNISHEDFLSSYKSTLSNALELYGNSRGYTFTSQAKKYEFYSDLAWAGLYNTSGFNSLSITVQNRIKDTIKSEETQRDRNNMHLPSKGNKACQ